MISHRGAHQTLPENSIPAFLRAIELGAEGIELDVHATKEGTVVVHHDRAVNSPERSPRRIADLTLSELQEFRLGDGIESMAVVANTIEIATAGVNVLG